MSPPSPLKLLLPATLLAWYAVGVPLVWKYAEDEPYYGFEPGDALLHVGLGSALLTLGVVWGSVLLWALLRRTLAPAWSALLLPLGVGLFYISLCPYGYVHDIAFFHVDCPRPGAPFGPSTR